MLDGGIWPIFLGVAGGDVIEVAEPALLMPRIMLGLMSSSSKPSSFMPLAMNSSKTPFGHFANVFVVFFDSIVLRFRWSKNYLGEEKPNNVMG